MPAWSAWGGVFAASVTRLVGPFRLDTGGHAGAVGFDSAILGLGVGLLALLGLWSRRRLRRAAGLAGAAALLWLGASRPWAATELDLLDCSARQLPGTSTVEIAYTLQKPSGPDARVDCEISRDGGRSWTVPRRKLEGDVGGGIGAGARKIAWDAGADEPAAKGSSYMARLTAQTIPWIQTRPIRATHERVEYFYALRAESTVGGPIHYRLVEGPAGMTVDPETGDVLWRPSAPGVYPVQVAASDSGGNETIQSYELSVLLDHWRAGDLHVHTTYSTDNTRGDRDQYRERARSVWTRKAQGLDWMCFSDHTDATAGDYPSWDDARRLTKPDFVALPCSEVSNQFDGHFNGIPRDLETFDHSGDYRTRWEDPDVTNQEELDEIHRRGGWAVLNHPFGPVWLTYDFSSTSFDAIEIWNGGGHNDDLDSQAIEYWLDQLGAGRWVVGVGGSDCHRYDEQDTPKLAEPATFVWADALDFQSITRSLFAGHVVVADHDNFLDFRARAGWSFGQAMPGDILELAPGEPIRFSMVGHCRYGSDVKIWALAPGQHGSQKRLVSSVHTPNDYNGRSSFEIYASELPPGDQIYYAETHHLAFLLDNVDYVRTNAIRVHVQSPESLEKD